MDIRGLFNEVKLGKIIHRVQKNVELTEEGHHIFKVMNSRQHRETAEIVVDHKFYPVWAVLEAHGVLKPRPDGDVVMAPSCGVKHCVHPDHLVWVDRVAHRESFRGDIFESKLSHWTPERKKELETMMANGTSQYQMAGHFGVAQSSINAACQALRKSVP